jgi:hypothetical protein
MSASPKSRIVRRHRSLVNHPGEVWTKETYSAGDPWRRVPLLARRNKKGHGHLREHGNKTRRTGAKFKAGEAVVLAALQHVAGTRPAPVHVHYGDKADALEHPARRQYREGQYETWEGHGLQTQIKHDAKRHEAVRRTQDLLTTTNFMRSGSPESPIELGLRSHHADSADAPIDVDLLTDDEDDNDRRGGGGASNNATGRAPVAGTAARRRADDDEAHSGSADGGSGDSNTAARPAGAAEGGCGGGGAGNNATGRAPVAGAAARRRADNYESAAATAVAVADELPCKRSRRQRRAAPLPSEVKSITEGQVWFALRWVVVWRAGALDSCLFIVFWYCNS